MCRRHFFIKLKCRGCKENIVKYQAKEILRRLYVLGGCGADRESWADGWDTAITEAISIVENVTGVSIGEILD